MFVSENILNIIYRYLNPNEFYLEELKYKTSEVYNFLNEFNPRDDWRRLVIISSFPNWCRYPEYWCIRNPFFASKLEKISILREKSNSRRNDYGLKNSVKTNSCYLDY